MNLVFNELSVSPRQLPIYEADEIWQSFIKTYSFIVKTTSISRSIITSIDINNIEISKGYYVSQWRNSTTVDKDDKRRFLGMCERQQLNMPQTKDFEYVQYGELSGDGLLLSYEYDMPLISIPSDDKWKESVLKCVVYNLNYSDEERDVELVNIYDQRSYTDNEKLIESDRMQKLLDIRTSNELLEAFSSEFPSLILHSNAQKQIQNVVDKHHLKIIIRELNGLEQVMSKWDGNQFDVTEYPPRYISFESQATLQQYEDEHTFIWEGTKLVVSYHVRYTGLDKPGRIYFYPLKKQKKCLVCSLLTKLPTVNDPH